MGFYGDILLELLVALGGALFLGNALALVKRRGDRDKAAREAVKRARPGSPVRAQVRVATTGTLPEAPLGCTVAYMLLGFVVAIWAIASLTS